MSSLRLPNLLTEKKSTEAPEFLMYDCVIYAVEQKKSLFKYCFDLILITIVKPLDWHNDKAALLITFLHKYYIY